MSSSSNRVFLDEAGFIRVIFEGDLNYDSVERVTQQLEPLISAFHQQNKPALVLIDITKVGKQDSGARKAGQEGLKRLKYDKFAICGGDFFVRNIAGILVKGIGKTDTVKFFKTQDEAIGWLKS